MNKIKRDSDTDCLDLDDDNICELEHLRKLFIGGLAPYTTEESLKEFYSKWGNVVDVVVMRDPNTKRSRGFGFITYTKSHMVDKAQENRPHIIDGKTVEAKRALPRPERQASESKNVSVKKLFVGGLKDNHDEACLTEYFSQFGKVVSIKILTDKTTGKRRGFAFIEFDDYDAVDKAILQKNHSIKYVLVDVKKSVYNQEMQKKNAQKQIMSNKVQQQQQQQHPQQPTPTLRPMTGGPNRQQAPISNGMNGMAPPQMPPYQQAPPPNYNQWGPPPPVVPGYPPYGGYQPPPMPQGPQQMGNWGYPPTQNNWNGPPPPSNVQQPPVTWQQTNQWGPAPPVMPVPGPMPPNNMPPPGAQPPPNWQQPPPGPPPSIPPQHQQQPLQQQQQQPQPPNFGTGYQQNYGGGPTKHQNTNNNRMNPYGVPPNTNNVYSNNIQIPPGTTYNNYMTGPPNLKSSVNNSDPGPVPKPMIHSSANNLNANKYRR